MTHLPQSTSRAADRAGRRVDPEFLDSLPPADPRAIRARRDLQRVNAWMGSARILTAALLSLPQISSPPRILEIGAGDGTLMLRIARGLQSRVPEAEMKFLDLRAEIDLRVLAELGTMGWRASALQGDVFEWLAESPSFDIVVANLFLHHFDDAALATLFQRISKKTRALVACEPRRFVFPRLAGSLVRLIGCSAMTCHDAIVSIAAGFIRTELTALWPPDTGWDLKEGNAGRFSHLFVAVRRANDSGPESHRPDATSGNGDPISCSTP